MKRILLTIGAIILLCTSAYGWGRKEHAAVAKIAENHLTPSLKALSSANGTAVIKSAKNSSALPV